VRFKRFLGLWFIVLQRCFAATSIAVTCTQKPMTSSVRVQQTATAPSR